MDRFFKWQFYYNIDGGKIEQEKNYSKLKKFFFIIFLSQGFK